ncbi:MAG: SpoIID/LytB domain-containing protein [Elusimicrobiota bacterium]
MRVCAEDIRVLLTYLDDKDIEITVPEGGYTVGQAKGGTVDVGDDGSIDLEDGLVIAKDGEGKLGWGGKPYRGHLEIRKTKQGKLALVNTLAMEEYLSGVLASEVDTKTWPMEALKAQAVVARTYAGNALRGKPGAPFHLGSKANHQVYFGAAFEDFRALQAVEDTDGEVLYNSDGAPLEAYFHSCCGGRTADASDVWSAKAPRELKGVTDFGYCKMSPHYSWVTSLPVEELERALREVKPDFLGPVKGFSIGTLERSSRVLSLRVTTNFGRFEVPTQKLRQALGPNWIRSTKITRIHFDKGRFLIYGKGWGHGVGLCQWGAKGMADDGWDYQRILRHYFPGAKLARIESTAAGLAQR